MDDDWPVGACVGVEDSVVTEVSVNTWPLDVWITKGMLVVEDSVLEVGDVVVEEVLEVVLLVATLVVLGGTEVLLDEDGNDVDNDDEGVTELVVSVEKEVVEGSGVGDVGVVLVGKGEEGVSEVAATGVVVGTSL